MYIAYTETGFSVNVFIAIHRNTHKNPNVIIYTFFREIRTPLSDNRALVTYEMCRKNEKENKKKVDNERGKEIKIIDDVINKNVVRSQNVKIRRNRNNSGKNERNYKANILVVFHLSIENVWTDRNQSGLTNF